MSIHQFRSPRIQRDARLYRILQAAAAMKLYESENGKPAATTEDLEAWAATRQPSELINPYSIPTQQEIADILTRAG